jgi:Tfp pilus assembly protein PilN
MIRINLIQPPGHHDAEKQREGGEVTRMIALYALVSAGVCLIVVGGLYGLWSFQINARHREIAAAQAEAIRLTAIEAQNRRLQTELAGIDQHIILIQTLERERTGPQQLMTAIGGLVDRIGGLYLLSVDAKSRQVNINGQADDVPAIADFITALQGSQSFSNVSLREISEADVGNRVSFQFGLECLYKPPVEMAASMELAAPTGATKRPPGR